MYHFLWFLPAGLKTKTMSQMQQHLFILALKTLTSQAASPSLPYTRACVCPGNQMFMQVFAGCSTSP